MAEDLHDIGEDKSLLLVDDDEPFLRRLAKAMEKRGFAVETAELTRNQIIQQASLSVLSQANQRPQSALSLLS